ncbi:UNVERIFIED_CONTAM: hypothetical protein HHA_240270 [Hammondia hammondi]|eukprot:XP_008887789.1 hypothetical protein HHA_240270 [Hammondia hammondi]
MAVPKGKRSKHKCKQRQLIYFFDQFDGVFKRRRESFYRSFYNPPYFSKQAEQTSLPPSVLRPFRFPGFWPGRFAFKMASSILTRGRLQ